MSKQSIWWWRDKFKWNESIFLKYGNEIKYEVFLLIKILSSTFITDSCELTGVTLSCLNTQKQRSTEDSAGNKTGAELLG